MDSAHSLNHPAFLLGFGVLVGVFSGLMGLGGGAVMIPVMVLAFGLSQHKAHGTSLAAMLPLVMLPAVLKYHAEGHVDWRFAAYLAGGMFVGSFFGALLANLLPKDELKLVFGFILVYVAGYTVFSYFGKEHLTRTVILATVLAVVTVGMFAVVRAIDGKRTATEATEAQRGEGAS